jgi:GTP-binding protein
MPGSTDSMDVAVRAQVELAVTQSDLIVFVVDGREGLNPVDREIATQLRRTGRPVIIAANKLDDYPRSSGHFAFYELGLGDPMPLSAAVGKASGDLLDAIVAALPPKGDKEDEASIQVAVIGRPNAGKSSLINRLLGEERLVVSAEPGTTRDAIDTPLQYHGKTLNFIDTAGLRRRAKVEDDVEFYSTLRTHRAVERADVCVLVVDAKLGMHTQDLRIATEAWDRGAGLIIAVNKWDLIPEKDANTAKRGEDILTEKAPFLRYVPFVYLSAQSGQRVTRIPELIIQVAEAREKRVGTAEVNRVLQDLLARTSPPQQQGEEIKLLYASQIGTHPPTIAIVSNRPDDVPEAYQRYLHHGFRSAWGFEGAPLRIKFSGRGASQHERDDGRRTRGGG